MANNNDRDDINVINDNNTDMFRIIDKAFSVIREEPVLDKTLMIHQYLLVEFVKRYRIRNQKGLCVYMEMGSGKTHPMCKIALDNLMRNYRVFFFIHHAQGSFVKRIMNEMFMNLGKEGMDKLEKRMESQIKYMPLVTPKKYKDSIIDDIADRMTEEELSDKISRIVGSINLSYKGKEVRNKIFLFDECHIFFSMIAKNNPTANMFYRYLSKLDDSNLIYYFTGTIIKNNPYELKALNTLIVKKHGLVTYSRIPETFTEFQSHFINTENGKLKNKNVFMNRIYGLIYYVGSKRDITDKPILVERNYILCEMSTAEFANYLNLRIAELKNKKELADRSKSVETDQESMSYGKLIQVASTNSSRLFCSGMVESKYKEALRLVKDTYGVALIYTIFPKTISPKLTKFFTDAGYGVDLITGETPIEQRQLVVDKVNADDNRRGEKIKVVILSSVGEMMLNFFNVTMSIVFAAPAELTQIEQFEMRGVRPGSLKHLPPEKRYVESHVLLSCVNSSITTQQWDEYISNNLYLRIERSGTIEERSMREKILRYESLKTFVDAIQESSINCSNIERKCYKLEANDMPLYYDNISDDLLLPPASKQQEEIKSVGRSIIIDNIKYFYNTDDENKLHIYEYNSITGTSSLIENPDPEILNKILNVSKNKNN